MSAKMKNLSLFFLIVLLSFNLYLAKENNIYYRCGVNDDKFEPKILEVFPSDKNETLKRKLDTPVEYHDFKIYFDTTNLERQLIIYNMTKYRTLFLNCIQKCIETLQKLLKVKTITTNYGITKDAFNGMDVEYIDEELFPPSELEKGILFKSLGYDLIIFGRIQYLGESTIANARAFWMDYAYDGDGQPFSGIVTINNKFDYSVEKSQEYF